MNSNDVSQIEVHALKIRRVSDPVHGYIEFTELENQILNQRASQRLRWIAQSGLAQYVFPEVRTSRFSHSLGAMHLNSKLLSGCVRNANSSVRNELGEALVLLCKQCLPDHANRGRKEHLDLHPLEKILPPNPDGILLAYVYFANESHQHAAKIVEQAFRLAGLFHDLGHLPFSHDFEEALKLLWSPDGDRQRGYPSEDLVRVIVEAPNSLKKSKVHERIGYGVAKALMETAVQVSDAGLQNYIDMVKRLTFWILVSEVTEFPQRVDTAAENAVLWIRSLLDSDIDADKCDYLLRDGRNYGFEFASYNLVRLINNVVLAKNDEGRFVLAVRSQGLSSVESLVLARARSYQYGVRHHKVVQVGAALRYGIREVIRSAQVGDDVFQFLEDIAKLAKYESLDGSPEALLRRYAFYDDGWLMAKLRKHSVASPTDEWLALVCWRSPGPRSLWKRANEFEGYIGKVFKAVKPERSLLSAWNEANLGPDLGRRKKLEELEKSGVLVATHSFRPWTSVGGESIQLQLLTDNERLVPVSKISALLRELIDVWQEDVLVHAFVASDSEVTALECIQRLTAA